MHNLRRAVATIAVIAAVGVPTAVSLAPIAGATPTAALRLEQRPRKVPADANGHPIPQCAPENDGEQVETEDADGGRHRFICKYVKDLFGPDYWEWNEILLM